jgi:hypothetical protein
MNYHLKGKNNDPMKLEISAEVLEKLHDLELPKNDPMKLEINAREAS